MSWGEGVISGYRRGAWTGQAVSTAVPMQSVCACVHASKQVCVCEHAGTRDQVCVCLCVDHLVSSSHPGGPSLPPFSTATPAHSTPA